MYSTVFVNTSRQYSNIKILMFYCHRHQFYLVYHTFTKFSIECHLLLKLLTNTWHSAPSIIEAAYYHLTSYTIFWHNSKTQSFLKISLEKLRVFTSDRTLRSHFLYVCMSVCPSHNQIIRLNEKVNLIENLPRFELRTFGIEV